jgi:hypothetical protein
MRAWFRINNVERLEGRGVVMEKPGEKDPDTPCGGLFFSADKERGELSPPSSHKF